MARDRAGNDADAMVYPVEPEDLMLFAPFSRVSRDPDASPPALVNASGAPAEARRNASLPCGVGVPSETADFMQQTIPPIFAFAREGTATLPLPMLLSRRPGPWGARGFCAAEKTDLSGSSFSDARVRDEHEKLTDGGQSATQTRSDDDRCRQLSRRGRAHREQRGWSRAGVGRAHGHAAQGVQVRRASPVFPRAEPPTNHDDGRTARRRRPRRVTDPTDLLLHPLHAPGRRRAAAAGCASSAKTTSVSARRDPATRPPRRRLAERRQIPSPFSRVFTPLRPFPD